MTSTRKKSNNCIVILNAVKNLIIVNSKTMTNVYQYWVYMMSNKTRSVLYIGITNDLFRRYLEHRDGIADGFTKRYKCRYLVYFEEYNYVEEAIAREKELKGWKREKKERLVSMINPLKQDLAEDMGWVDRDPCFSPSDQRPKGSRCSG